MALSASTCAWTQGTGGWGDTEMLSRPINLLSRVVAALDLASQLIRYVDGFAGQLWLCNAPDGGQQGSE